MRLHRKLVILSSVVLILLSLGVVHHFRRSPSADSNRLTQAGRLTFESQHHDFGKPYPGEEMSCEFHFRNTGDGILHILDLKTSCGCTVAKLADREYSPGKAGTISVNFRLPPHPDPTSHGVTIQSDDPTNPEARLTVFADPEWPVAVSPETIHFFTAVVEESVTQRRLEVFTPSGHQFQITKIATSSPNVQTRETENNGRRYIFDVRITFDRPGAFREAIEIHTDIPTRELIRIPVEGSVSSRSNIVPSRMMLGRRRFDEIVETQLVVEKPERLGTLSDVRIAAGGEMRVLDWNTTSDSRLVIRMRVQGPATDGYHKANLEVLFSETTEPLVVPISCVSVPAEEPAPAKTGVSN